jgi:hypothetical protein
MISTLAKPSIVAHDADCMCPPCMDADMNAHILANGGQEALDRINNEMQLIGGGKVEAERMRFMPSGSNCGGGTVKPATAKMVKFLKVLLSTKDMTGIHIFPGQYATVETAHKNSFQGGKALIDKLINANDKPNQTVRMASDGQKKFIASLNSQIIDPGYKITEADIKGITFAEVNEVLTLLKNIIKAEREESTKRVAKTPAKNSEITEGMYRKSDGTIYKVAYTRQSRQLVAYKWNLFTTLVPTAKGLKYGEFNYEGKSPLYSLSIDDRLTLEQAKALGAEFHYCIRCGIELTKQSSIDQGMGDWCASKY